MGSHSECWLESLYVASQKSDFDHDLMQLFRASDKQMCRSAIKDLPEPLRRSYPKGSRAKFDAVYYAAPAALVRDRLELKGYTLETAKRAFMKRIRAEIREYTEEVIEGMEDSYEHTAKMLGALNVDQWLATLREIKKADLGVPEWAISERGWGANLKEFMLANRWYGFAGADLNVPLRLALEISADDDNLIYDLTDLISGGYFDKNEDFVAVASEFASSEHASRSKIIVLTEGRSDGWILAESMRLLYPHLADYFAFMDFDTAKIEGGVSHLARIVKSFAGAGIVNKVLALFDNDTAGEEALHSLRNIKLPSNLRVMKLPTLESLRRYPTIGPSGPVRMNVNGKAASIELYLGEDVLREDGKLVPVQWSGYNSAMKKYQGAVLGKDKIHKRFAEKLARQKQREGLSQDPCWSGLCAIMASIFSAFHGYDRKLILSDQLERRYNW